MCPEEITRLSERWGVLFEYEENEEGIRENVIMTFPHVPKFKFHSFLLRNSTKTKKTRTERLNVKLGAVFAFSVS